VWNESSLGHDDPIAPKLGFAAVAAGISAFAITAERSKYAKRDMCLEIRGGLRDVDHGGGGVLA